MRLPRLRFFRGFSLSLALAPSVFGQSYTISTFAGGGLPVNIPGTSAGISYPQFIASDSAGDVFFVDQSEVLRLDAKTGILTLAAGNGTVGFSGDGGPATAAQLNHPAGVAVDSAGNLYIADASNNRIRKVSNGVITTVAGNGTQGFSGDGGPATSAQLSFFPGGGVAVDSAGNLYIADTQNARIRKVSNGVITTVAGNGTVGFSGDGGPATSAELNLSTSYASPSSYGGIAVDSAGNLYIADSFNFRVREVSNGIINTVAGGGASLANGGPATSAAFEPYGVAVDSVGNLYIADGAILEVSNGLINTVAGGSSGSSLGGTGVAVDSASNLYIADPKDQLVLKLSGGVEATIAGNGTCCFSGDNGPATSAELYNPFDVAVDSAGNLYIADTKNNRIRQVSNGVITTVAGNGMSGDGGSATSAAVGAPTSVAVDSAGNLYIAAGGSISKVSGGMITTVAGGGQSSGDNIPVTSADLFPAAIAVDSAGNLYIADYSSQRIRKVSSGIITTIAGNGTKGFSGDGGPATSAELALAQAPGLAVDSAGNVYIADTGNNRVRMVSNGIITTVAGNGTCCFSGDGGPATAAQLDGPEGVAVDSAGNLYIADTFNLRIRKVSGGVITTVAGGGTSGLGDSGPATSASLWVAEGVALDSAGNVYLADTGNQRIRLLTPSGPTCSAVTSPVNFMPTDAGGNLSVTIQAAAACAWAVQGLPPWITYSGNAIGSGPATITLAVAPNSGPPRSAIISVAGTPISVGQPYVVTPPPINITGIVNAATGQAGPLALGSIAAISGTFPLTAPASASGLPLPYSLAGLALQFSGIGTGGYAPLFFADASEVIFQVPWNFTAAAVASRPIAVEAGVNGEESLNQAGTLALYSPGIFSTNGQGTGQGAILSSSYVLVDSANPATAANNMVQIYCTGLGSVTYEPSNGWPAPSSPLSTTTTTPTVSIDSVNATVMFSGLAPGLVGIYQVNAVVPPSVFGNGARQVPVVISIGNQTSNTVTMAVQ
jgi:uncharacterized protein (TIGR03437 family)